jgi:energy-coupling factor transport system ATP-binding protein
MGIKIRNLGFAYSEVPILRNINLEVNEGEFLGIVGPTGSGKTTFAFCLNGIIPNLVRGKFSGDVEVSGKNTKSSEVFDLAKSVGLVFQDPDSQIFSVAVEDEISFGLENMGLQGGEIRKRVESVMKALGIEDLKGKDTFALSLGQKQKLCMASILAMDPEILVLDEPTSQLDFRGTKGIYEILKGLNKNGKTIILIEHKVDWLLKYAERILVLDKGNFVLDGKPPEVFRDPRLEKIGIEVPKVFRIEKLLKKSGIRVDLERLAGV